ncbi:putative DNA topoisomerase transcription factor interactor and regulator CCHC(Zn) family [Lupinus albus]|uniref:DNA topoisomerase n=1 Tax=Lupinus albus TaxID=3870 RepID=A0A6A4PRB6_LUPAL|nr:putative DNA topoisomerase transcription factor interactor and regulator CCHC(Zn) family [Lupinus albus]
MGTRTVTVLNVAEKPSVAKSVSAILSRNQGLRVREGRSRYNKIFEFSYSIRGQPCQMLFTSVTGHLMELEFEDRYRKWHSCDPADLYHAPVRKFVPEDKKDIKRTLEEEARRCQWLVLWLDCDREGENIAFEVVDVCTAANRYVTLKRARFSALIDREIHNAVQNLVEPNKWFADAVDARQEIDLRIGASFTRFQTMLLRDAFIIDTPTDDRNLVLSYGPCQFPTLGFVVERYWEIQAHEPEEFWLINCSHRSDEGVANFSWMRGHLFDYTCATIIYEMCIEEPNATVTNVRQQEKLKYPPYPLNTIELEKRASRYFRMSSEHTMKVAEELYQAGFISYPRTETDSFSSRTDLHTIVQEQQGHPEWGIYAQRLLDPGTGLWRNPRGGGHDDKAHPPIHPTKFSAGEAGWSQDHRKLYELVVRHFLACVSKPAVGAETTVEIDIAGEQFSVCGRVILEKNYLDVYPFESWGGSMIPTYTVGQQFIPTTLTLDSGVTRPPPLLSEADLLSSMDKEGIGTDATMHDHIKKLLDRFYVTKDSSTRFTPTNLGEALVMGYDDMGYKLWKPDLRAVMERDMKSVSEGVKSKDEVLATSLQQMKACFLDARLNKVKLLEAMGIFFERSNRAGGDELHATGEVVRKCGLCQESDMVLKKNRDGNFMVGCLGFPQCRNAVWLPGSVSEAAVTTNTCNICTPGPVYLIQFKFRQLEIPPNYSVNHLGCIGGCDEVLTQLTEICGRGPRMPARARGPITPASHANQSNTRQGLCTNCQQTGHSSNDCPSQNLRSRNAEHRRVNQHNDIHAGEDSVSCSSCGAPCVLRTANTANNRGRKFYSCQSQECNFFVWKDSLNNSTGERSFTRSNTIPASNPGRNGGRGRGQRGRGSRNGPPAATTTFVSATGDPISGRRCFVCGDPSHFANVCPNRGG